MESVRNSLEYDCHRRVELVLPGTTGLSQPMDVSVMRPFKHRCRMLYLALNRDHGFAAAPRGKRKRIAQIVVSAWKEISGEVIVAGFERQGSFARQNVTKQAI